MKDEAHPLFTLGPVGVVQDLEPLNRARGGSTVPALRSTSSHAKGIASLPSGLTRS